MNLLVLNSEENGGPVDALAEAARALGLDAQIEVADSVGQLLIALQDRPFALTLLPGDARSGLVDSIRRLHPGAPLARYVAEIDEGGADPRLPQLSLAQLPQALGSLLGLQSAGQDDAPPPEQEEAEEAPVPVTAAFSTPPPAEAPPATLPASPVTPAPTEEMVFDAEQVQAIVQEMDLPPAVRQVLLIRDHRLQVNVRPAERSSNGTVSSSRRRAATAPLDIEAADLLAGQVAAQFSGRDLTAQIHFFQEPGTEKSVVVYSRPAPAGYLLSLVAAPDTSSGLLRRTAEGLVHRLGQAHVRRPAGQPNAAVLIDTPLPTGQPADNPFALAWQPRKPLPAALHQPLRLAVERIAGANACHVRHLSLRPEYVQLVVACPPGRNSAWVAHTFKRGMELDIQRQFNIPARLWADGYFARESLEPLSNAELKLFLNPPG